MTSETEAGGGVDAALRVAGAWGRFPVLSFVVVLGAVLLTGCYASVYNFEAMDVPFRCAVPECSNEEQMVNYSGAWVGTDGGDSSRCVRYALFVHNESKPSICAPEDFDTSTLIPCTGYRYEQNHSIVSEWGLGCADWMRTLVGTVHNAGFFVSIPLTGLVSDRWGRRVALLLACLANACAGLLRAFSTSYAMFIALEFLEPALGGGCYTAAFVLVMELVVPEGRVLVSLLVNLCFISGGVAVTLAARYLQNWRHLLLLVYAPALLALPATPLLTESPRWLLSKGHPDEALNILQKAAKSKKKTLPEEIVKQIEAQAVMQDNSGDEELSEAQQLVRSWVIWRRCLVCSFLWVTCTLVYYGLSINAVTLAGDPYVNYVIVLVVEVPANCCKLLMLDRLGRKRTIAPAFLASGLVLISYAFIPGGAWPLVFYLGGKFFITLAYNSLYVFVAEVFPTSYRTTLLSLCSTVGRIGSALAPQTPLLALVYEFLPTMLFGIMAIISAALVLLLPETLRRPLPDSLRHAEQLQKSASRQSDTKL